MMVETESYKDEFQAVISYVDNPFDQEEVASQAEIVGHDEFASFCREISEDIYLIKAREWYNE